MSGHWGRSYCNQLCDILLDLNSRKVQRQTHLTSIVHAMFATIMLLLLQQVCDCMHCCTAHVSGDVMRFDFGHNGDQDLVDVNM